jgi:glucose/arabinose dehydrogenase
MTPSSTFVRRVLRRALASALSLSFLVPAVASAATLPAGFTEAIFASGLSNPTAMQFAPDGRLFVCQQGGALRVVKDGVLLPAPFVSLTVDQNGERGLLGVAFHPNFTTTDPYVYVYYTVPGGPGVTVHNRVSRFTANGDVALAGSEVPIIELDDLSGATNHNGGAIDFGPDGKLYIAVGDNANSAFAQSMSTRHGKMLRYDADGTIPADNPFYATASGENRAIWALGLRNPFTFALSAAQSVPVLMINDVGQGGWEEVNPGAAGANYGWPATEGDFDPATYPAFTRPRHAYANDSSTCAITGGAFYSPANPTFPAYYQNAYFFADFCGGWIRYLDPTLVQTFPLMPAVARTFATGISGPVDLKVGSDGALYYLARGHGRIYRVTYTGQEPGPSPLGPAGVGPESQGGAAAPGRGVTGGTASSAASQAPAAATTTAAPTATRARATTATRTPTPRRRSRQ